MIVFSFFFFSCQTASSSSKIHIMTFKYNCLESFDELMVSYLTGSGSGKVVFANLKQDYVKLHWISDCIYGDCPTAVCE